MNFLLRTIADDTPVMPNVGSFMSRYYGKASSAEARHLNRYPRGTEVKP